MIQHKKITYRIITLGILMMCLLLKSNTISAQVQGNIGGPTTANMGDTKRYTLFLSGFQGNPTYTWYTTGGTVVSQTNNHADIRFVDSGTVTITAVAQTSSGYYSYNLQVTVAANVTTPPNPTVYSTTCSSATLRRSGTPSGVSWYWQGKNAYGTSLSLGSGSFFTANQGSGRYYIRAFDNNGNWSNSSGYVDVTIPDITPPAVYVSTNCDSAILGWSATPPSGVNWYWQSSPTGKDTSNTSSSITVTSGNTIYLRARDSQGCWSAPREVNYGGAIYPPNTNIPPMPAIVNNCGSTTITRAAEPNGYLYFWQTSATGESQTTSDQQTSITLTTGTVYYLRSYDWNSGCWSPPRVINYSVNPIPKWYTDTDGDGFGDPDSLIQQCTQPAGYINKGGDRCPQESGEKQGCIFNPHDLTLSNENYVFTRVYQEEMTSSTQINYRKDVIESITYFDGLGRPMQQRAIQASPDAKDIVTHIDYDAYGRQDKQYLPFEATGAVGSYNTVDINTDINTYYKNTYLDDFTGIAANHTSFNAYSESIFEASPLNRVTEQGAPGKAWKADRNSDTDHTIKFNWETNITDEVIHFEVTFENNDTEKPQLVKTGNYSEKELYVTITKDENWKPADNNNRTVRVYKDKLGKVVLERKDNEGVTHDTYFVYDDFGNLTYVIPPKVNVTDGVSILELDELCYQNKYDYRNRLIENKIPGKGDINYLESVIYNDLDQPIMTQDPNQKANEEWLFTKYDVFGRVAYTGKLIDNRNRKIIQEEANNFTTQLWVERSGLSTIGSVPMYYTSQGYPSTSNMEVLTVNYYDNYDMPALLQNSALPQDVNSFGTPVDLNAKGLPTVTQVKVLGTNNWITSSVAYDIKGREIASATRNEYLKTTDIIELKLDFIGKVEESKSTHIKDGKTPIITMDMFEYDHIARLTNHTQNINGQEQKIISNIYDPLGRLISEEVGGGLQTVDYKYNVRGWLTRINDMDNMANDLFAFGINYEAPKVSGLNATPLYNGNISETLWKTASDNIQRAYGYLFDDFDRIKTSSFTNNLNINTGEYNSAYSYDKNGNLLSLTRNTTDGAGGYTQIDNLVYAYTNNNLGNKLESVIDSSLSFEGFKDGNTSGADYLYDINGNMNTDRNKGITGTTYNHFNLPVSVTISNSEHTGNISYIYDATGTKLRKVTTEGSSLTTTDYAGDFIYKNGDLEFFSHPKGYIEPNGSNFDYVFQYKDHLDNIRLSYSDMNQDGVITPASEIRKEQNYYPFGLTHKGYNSGIIGRNHNYGFNSVEYSEELDMNLYEMDIRKYDPSIARWTSMDPIIHHSLSPFNGFDNNPIYWADPSGADSETLGADGLTNSQWMGLSRPGGGGFDGMKAQARENYSDQSKSSVRTGELSIEGPDCPKCPTMTPYELQGYWELGYTRFTTEDGEGNFRHYYSDGRIEETTTSGFQKELQDITGLFLINSVGKIFKLFTRAKNIPRGFADYDEFVKAGKELKKALDASGLKYSKMGVRGSSVTGVSSKGGGFRTGGSNPSDIDVFVEFSSKIGINTSKNIKGFIHPLKLFKKFPALKAWSERWSKILGREITPGGFNPGTMTDKNIIKF